MLEASNNSKCIVLALHDSQADTVHVIRGGHFMNFTQFFGFLLLAYAQQACDFCFTSASPAACM